MKNISTAAEREKAEKTNLTSDGIKVIVKYPSNVSDAVKQEKINRIYDILTKHRSA
jgi:hypothetical protein